ncbi:hypothetical protein CEXT_687821 [Caerostris extrusa]|uniref:Uncharacterized protein n=1 Tax=Caerostris extrusa TaxID=172846 RepID=A0AAV4QTP3_CAEEX|nr:hypothetical protein CEXT_687821 [Caerostris extrusa]
MCAITLENSIRWEFNKRSIYGGKDNGRTSNISAFIPSGESSKNLRHSSPKKRIDITDRIPNNVRQVTYVRNKKLDQPPDGTGVGLSLPYQQPTFLERLRCPKFYDHGISVCFPLGQLCLHALVGVFI